jgi:hypothetical protein
MNILCDVCRQIKLELHDADHCQELRIFQARSKTELTYVSGLCLEDLVIGLSWYQESTEEPNDAERVAAYRASSFSWASADGLVQWGCGRYLL